MEIQKLWPKVFSIRELLITIAKVLLLLCLSLLLLAQLWLGLAVFRVLLSYTRIIL